MKRRVISAKYLPIPRPLFPTLVFMLVLDRLPIGWWSIVAATLWCLVIAGMMLIINDEISVHPSQIPTDKETL